MIKQKTLTMNSRVGDDEASKMLNEFLTTNNIKEDNIISISVLGKDWEQDSVRNIAFDKIMYKIIYRSSNN